jgi:hypothetical protein
MSNAETGTGASRVLFLNSADATQNLSDEKLTTDYIFVPDESIVVPPHHQILLSIHHTQIPYSFYNFQVNRNCRLDYSLTAYNTIATADTGFVQVPAGNYNASTLARKLTELLNAEANVGTLTMRLNRDTLKYEYNWIPDASASYKRLTFRIANGANKDIDMRDEIGFNDNMFVDGNANLDVWFENDGVNFRGGSSDGATNQTIIMNTTNPATFFWNGDNTATLSGGATAENFFSVVDMFASIRSLYIRTNLTTSSILDSSIGGGFSGILARIPINVNSGGIITIDPTDGAVHKLLLKIREITFFYVRLTDQKNRLIDLNGLDWDISLQFDFIEKPSIRIPKDKRREVEQAMYEKFKTDKQLMTKKK